MICHHVSLYLHWHYLYLCFHIFPLVVAFYLDLLLKISFYRKFISFHNLSISCLLRLVFNSLYWNSFYLLLFKWFKMPFTFTILLYLSLYIFRWSKMSYSPTLLDLMVTFIALTLDFQQFSFLPEYSVVLCILPSLPRLARLPELFYDHNWTFSSS